MSKSQGEDMIQSLIHCGLGWSVADKLAGNWPINVSLRSADDKCTLNRVQSARISYTQQTSPSVDLPARGGKFLCFQIFMPRPTESNACTACAKSKRKCGRQVPSCARCAHRGRHCIYPLLKSGVAVSSRPLLLNQVNDIVPSVEDSFAPELADNTSSSAASLNLGDAFTLDSAFTLPDGDLDHHLSLTLTSGIQMNTEQPWFLGPATWNVTHQMDDSASLGISSATMKMYIARLQSWFEQWVTTGSNPFIHSRLYYAKFPTCVQIAYATMSSYVHRTPANTDVILRIVEDRSNDLLRDNGAIQSNIGALEEWIDQAEQNTDIFAQLSRLHALMVYQAIGLFDGDIRSRHIAQSHVAVQSSWTDKLLHLAAKALSNIHDISTHLVDWVSQPFNVPQRQWYLWILSESIRRTWLVSGSIFAIFSALQQRFGKCPGGIMYTNRSGLWNATSATEWGKQCTGGMSAMFMNRFECASLFDHAVPADIDEFGTTILDVTFNRELVQKWRDASGVL